MDVTFACASAVVAHPETGVGVAVVQGQHWPADDPVVLGYPTMFTTDPRHGLSSSRRLRTDGYPEGYPSEDEDGDQTAPTPTETATKAPGERRTRR